MSKAGVIQEPVKVKSGRLEPGHDGNRRARNFDELSVMKWVLEQRPGKGNAVQRAYREWLGKSPVQFMERFNALRAAAGGDPVAGVVVSQPVEVVLVDAGTVKSLEMIESLLLEAEDASDGESAGPVVVAPRVE